MFDEALLIRIYESIVIEFFLRLKIHRISAGVPRFDIENLNFIVSMAKPSNILDMQFHGLTRTLRPTWPLQNNSRCVDPNLLF